MTAKTHYSVKIDFWNMTLLSCCKQIPWSLLCLCPASWIFGQNYILWSHNHTYPFSTTLRTHFDTSSIIIKIENLLNVKVDKRVGFCWISFDGIPVCMLLCKNANRIALCEFSFLIMMLNVSKHWITLLLTFWILTCLISCQQGLIILYSQ